MSSPGVSQGTEPLPNEEQPSETNSVGWEGVAATITLKKHQTELYTSFDLVGFDDPNQEKSSKDINLAKYADKNGTIKVEFYHHENDEEHGRLS